LSPDPPDWTAVGGRPKGFVGAGSTVGRVSDPVVLPEFVTVVVQT
jgi:hypothetical protein